MTKIALITGASKGIGKEIAIQLGQQGVFILLGVRNISSGGEVTKELASLGIESDAVELDVSDPASIKKAITHIDTQYGKLDILINNAGILLSNDENEISTERLIETYRTNVFGVSYMIEYALTLLKQSANARIVNLSSGLGSFAWTRDPSMRYSKVRRPAYNTSKTAVNALTVQYAKILQPFNIKINAADPGPTATDMNKNGPRTVQEAAKTAVMLALLPDDGPTGEFFFDGEQAPF